MAYPDGPTLLTSVHATDRPPLRLTFREPPAVFPPGTTLDTMQQYWTAEAQQVAQALFDHLPGGLLDALLVEFCKRKANVLIVANPQSTIQE